MQYTDESQILACALVVQMPNGLYLADDANTIVPILHYLCRGVKCKDKRDSANIK